ncbi:phage major capsid protein [Erythrobacter sp. R86502]|uniref:phage major capsid protein n=1 Tax=Erythrobacter sp. R86502 TaxID=3093846 RepID=UPI0036D21ECF
MSDEVNKIGEIARAFEEFKSANDSRLAQLESKGSADVVTTDKVDRINDAISALQNEVTDLAKKSGRLASEGKEEDEYQVKFNEWARYGENERELKAMSVTGGVSIPKMIDANIIDQLKNVSAMRSLARVVSVSTTDFRMLLNDRATASGWVSENAARPETNTPAVTELTVPFGILYANPAASQVSLEDGVFNVEAFLAAEIAAEFAEAEGAAFINGTGTDQPRGILAAGTGIEQITTDGVGALTGDDILDLVYSLKSGHRTGAAFVMNSATMAVVRKLKDADGQYLWSPSLAAGQPATLCGYAGYEDDHMPDVATGNEAIAFGNFQRGYVIADRMGVDVLRDPFTNKPYVHFYATKRVGGRVLDPQAIKLLSVR